jgi:DNA repair ATPase RecN
MQMKNLIMTFLSKINNNNVNGTRLIDVIKELIDIFKQVKSIDVMRNTDNALDSILKNTFEQKVNKFYDEINNRIKQLDRTLIGLENNNQGIKDYLIDYTRNGLRETWNIYNDSIKNEVDNIIDKYQNKLSLDIISKCKEIQDKIRNSQIKIVTLSENKDVDDFFQKFSFPEEINQNQVDELIQKIINDFFANFTNEFNCLSPEFKQEVQEYL